MKYETNTTTRETETPKFKIQILEYGKHLYDEIQLIIAPEFKEKHTKKGKQVETPSNRVQTDFQWELQVRCNSVREFT